MLVRVCLYCRRNFEAYPSAIRAGRGRYCSRACRGASGCNIKHGDSRTRLYSIWCGIKQRCGNQRSPAFPYYGGRGIRLADEWTQFSPFKEWALANGYRDDLEVDRIDSDGPYSPANCRWATRTEQMRNTGKRRDAKTSSFRGVSWCENAGKWRAQITHPDRPSQHIGLFDTETEAAKAYDAEAHRLFGEFAAVNFRDERKVSHFSA